MDKTAQSPDRARPAPVSLAEFARRFSELRRAVSGVVLGQDEVVTKALVCLLAEGHLLIEGVPGLGKTLLAKTLAGAISGSQARIQFTADLLPTDITGSLVWNPVAGGFIFHEGPVFHNVVLADEINRASAKAHAALLEAMEEGHVTVDETRTLPKPFFVIATQNPLELQGTFRLPEAQLDRFAMRLEIGYPKADAEQEMVREDVRTVRRTENEEDLGRRDHDGRLPVITLDGLEEMVETAARTVEISDGLAAYLVDLAATTRERRQQVRMGVSPRATLTLAATSRVLAATVCRDHVTIEDVRTLLPAVFAHRMSMTPEAQRDGVTAYDVIEQIVAGVPVPGKRW